MAFSRLITLKIAFQARQFALRALIVVVTCMSCGLLHSSLHAGCGDHVILTGQVPAHLLVQHLAEQQMFSHEMPRDLKNQNRLIDLFTPQVPKPCHGPGCGQRRSPAMATTPADADQQQQNFFYSSDTDSARKNRAGRFSLSYQPLFSNDHQQRIDRPPRV